MTTINNVLFDFGKVLLDFDNDNAKKHFKKLGVDDYEKHVMELHAQNVFNELETGKLSANQFINTISQKLNGSVSDKEIQNAWNSILMGYRTESMKHLERLKNRFNLYLLSNTNALHHEQFDRILFNQLRVKSLDSYFTKAYYSHQIGMRKPDKKIYEFVLNDAGIKATETLFIDDLPENIAVASSLGFQTHLLLPEERIEKLKSLSY
jgi:putative hydrolase of the HAD superfamily